MYIMLYCFITCSLASLLQQQQVTLFICKAAIFTLFDIVFEYSFIQYVAFNCLTVFATCVKKNVHTSYLEPKSCDK